MHDTTCKYNTSIKLYLSFARTNLYNYNYPDITKGLLNVNEYSSQSNKRPRWNKRPPWNLLSKLISVHPGNFAKS